MSEMSLGLFRARGKMGAVGMATSYKMLLVVFEGE